MGDSIVRRAQFDIRCKPRVRWNGRGGARLRDLPNLLSYLSSSGPPPGLIIVHLGTNDLVPLGSFFVREAVRIFIEHCCANFPGARLIWSDIFPRACFFGALSQSKLEMKRRSINKWARSVSRRTGVSILHHPQFQWSFCHLFSFDGVHPSPEGLDIVWNNTHTCINSCYY